VQSLARQSIPRLQRIDDARYSLIFRMAAHETRPVVNARSSRQFHVSGTTLSNGARFSGVAIGPVVIAV
jgi:hypothetical protein